MGKMRGLRVMVFNATVNNISAISWRSVLLLEEIGIPGENQWLIIVKKITDRRCDDHMLVEFTTTCAISAYHH
jgi:hypothetical protein